MIVHNVRHSIRAYAKLYYYHDVAIDHYASIHSKASKVKLLFLTPAYM